MALKAPASRYGAMLCKGSGLLAETKALLRAWRPGETAIALRDRALAEDILGRHTASRVDDIVSGVFARRFLRPTDRPAQLLRRLLERGPGGALFNDLCLLYAARHDALLRDVIVGVYWPAARRRRLVVNPDDIAAFLSQAEEAGRISPPWSREVRRRVVSGALRTLVDLGLLRGVRRGPREILSYRPADATIVFLAHDLHFAGASDAALVGHEDWALFGLSPGDVTIALDRMTADGHWIVQAAGSLVRITWKWKSMEEVVDALAR